MKYINDDSICEILEAQFDIGSVVTHTRYNYCAVIIDVDSTFTGDDAQWAILPEDERPEKKQPWYHILIHDGEVITYAPESMLYQPNTPMAVSHPLLTKFLHENIEEGHYISIALMH